MSLNPEESHVTQWSPIVTHFYIQSLFRPLLKRSFWITPVGWLVDLSQLGLGTALIRTNIYLTMTLLPRKQEWPQENASKCCVFRDARLSFVFYLIWEPLAKLWVDRESFVMGKVTLINPMVAWNFTVRVFRKRDRPPSLQISALYSLVLGDGSGVSLSDWIHVHYFKGKKCYYVPYFISQKSDWG